MRIHHLNCGSDCPVGGALFDGRSTGPLAHLVCHCLLIETDAHGLVLVDTGYGLRDIRHPHAGKHPRITRTFRALLGIPLREEETAIRQVEALGFRADDVRHIVLTHLDFDHAGGLEDFPQAAVHVMEREWEVARSRPASWLTRQRYRVAQWDEVGDWRRYRPGGGDGWFGFEAVRDLDGLPPEILMVPLPGHTWGHAGVAVDTGASWLLHAGDAYFYRGEMRGAVRRCPPGGRALQRLTEVDRDRRLENQERLRRLSVERRGELNVMCAHDPVEWEAARAGAPL